MLWIWTKACIHYKHKYEHANILFYHCDKVGIAELRNTYWLPPVSKELCEERRENMDLALKKLSLIKKKSQVGNYRMTF